MFGLEIKNLKMFYEQNQILNVLNCAKCSKEFDEPRLLPCGKTVCNDCISALTIYSNPNSNMFDCAMCLDEHFMPSKGFPLNESLLKLLEQKPSEVYRGKVVETFKNNLESVHNKKQQLEFNLNNGEDTIKEHCMNLRCLIHASAETTIVKVNELADSLINQIIKYETECINSFQSISEGKQSTQKQRFQQQFDKIEKFYMEWSVYLKNLQYDEEAIIKANDVANKLSMEFNDDEIQIKSFIFINDLIKFEPNLDPIDRKLIGTIVHNQLSIQFKQIHNAKSLLIDAQPDSIVVDRLVSGDILFLYLSKRYDLEQFCALKCNPNCEVLTKRFSFLHYLTNVFKKYNDKVLYLNSNGLIQMVNMNAATDEFLCSQVLIQGENKEPLLLCMNETNVYCLLIKSQQLLIKSRRVINIMDRIKFQSATSEKPFYFPANVKQFECVDGKLIWLNATQLQILNEKTGDLIRSVKVVADKFILNSKNKIVLLNQAVQRLQVFHIDGALLAEFKVEENLLDVTFFLDKQDNVLFFNKKTLCLSLP